MSFEPVVLDGATFSPGDVARIARGGASVRLADEARARNDRARAALATLLARGEPIYGVSTGVGALRNHHIPEADRDAYSLRLLLSHACGAGRPVGAETRPLFRAVAAVLDADLRDRPLHPDVEAARRFVREWEPTDQRVAVTR